MSFSLSEFEKQIVYQDKDLIVLNKQPLQLVQTDKQGTLALENFVKDYLLQKKESDFCGIVHRLDRPVSGLVLFAKNQETLVQLNEQIKQQKIKKFYWAITQNAPPKQEDLLTHYLIKDEAKNKTFVVEATQPNAKKAELIYKVLLHSDRYHLLEVELLTGRHHQIRAQLAHIKCPIKGDLKYGAKRSNIDGSISLHAREMQFIHPRTRQKLKLIAPTPNDKLWQFFEEQLA